jgi:hypothetical protein
MASGVELTPFFGQRKAGKVAAHLLRYLALVDKTAKVVAALRIKHYACQ